PTGSHWIRPRRHTTENKDDLTSAPLSAPWKQANNSLALKRKERRRQNFVASATSAKQGAYLKRIAVRLFRNLLQLPTPHELRGKNRRQQTDDWEKRARFGNWIHDQGPLFEATLARIGTAECTIHVDEISRGRASEGAHRDECIHVAGAAPVIARSVHQHLITRAKRVAKSSKRADVRCR